ncbi:hypothetical protein TMEN_503 [Trichophyton mentagrophytes]|uniref:DUF221 domain-containing protein n=1 Tax=Trichophyton interdigitale (strain MR816) TaxID=1215338 RepID=A0A059J8G0_TRIIM|nr:hypothetical protein H101_01817 [Trichophyton interdigitale H6]KDB24151.1 hypothetical protein H109_03966 [Trichophyton interdigitale MR816]GBF59548.1 hypothetical protein TMEN_503 [Trichophyton mentagrophytes]
MAGVGDAIDQQSGTGQRSSGISISTFLASLATAIIVFAVEFVIFLILKSKLTRIYQPRTYLVPERERTAPSPAGLFRWIIPVFRTSNSEFIKKCGLDAYFFLRYLRMLLKIFIPLSIVILPILIPINKVGGRDTSPIDPLDHEFTTRYNVSGLDQLAWGNVRPEHSQRYWAHLILAVIVVVYVCGIFFDEFRGYIRLRQSYLTSPQHRLRASATTVLVTSIPSRWLSVEALDSLFDVFPGGVRNIWLNRDLDQLNAKIKLRNQLAFTLESAQTELIKKCKRAHLKQIKAEARKEGRQSKETKQQIQAENDRRTAQLVEGAGISSGDPHQTAHTVQDLLQPKRHKVQQVGAKVGHTVVGGLKRIGGSVHRPGGHRPANTQGNTEHAADDADVRLSSSSQANHHPMGMDGTVFDRHDDGRRLTASSPDVGGSPALPDTEQTGNSKKKDEYDVDKEYPVAYNEEYQEDDYGEPVWKKYIREKDRETMRLPIFGWDWMPSLPLLGKKVDTIYHCRKELARLNLEIEIDQQHPEKFPLMNSAFVQFNHQVAAHMACQSVSHHIPKQMTPRMVEISPDDVIWDNMSIRWWERYIRTFGVMVIVGAMVIGWAFPVAFTGLLSQLSYLENHFVWLRWLGKLPQWLISAIQGILPPLFLSILMALLPLVLRFLSRNQGVHTGMAIELTVQNYYFAFLFVQIFLVVSISSGFSTIIDSLKNVLSVPDLLAQNIPKASNYFFSYMVLQAMSVSAGALVQIFALISWFILAPLLDNTARKKWARATNLNQMQWGTFFPVYTTLASIGLIYCIISPLIMVFNVLTFSLFWIVYRYNTLYVTKFRFDTGGLLFPRAINQLFTGLYVMEICLIGMFFLVRDEKKEVACEGQAICMIIVLILTGLFQYFLNEAFNPLSLYLPITLEDEATQRDEEFARAQRRRRGIEEDDEELDKDGQREDGEKDGSIELGAMGNNQQQEPSSPLFLGSRLNRANNSMKKQRRKSWADRSSNTRSPFFGGRSDPSMPTIRAIRKKLAMDTESQAPATHAIGQSLFSGIHDELEDLTPEERDQLVQRAFQHEALRMRRPVIWVPRDDMGVSDDEIFRTQRLTKHIWISNEYQALDGKCRAIFSRSPPDFSEVDLIQL